MERIGFIGLGIMGKPMAGNLIAAGYSLTAHNRGSDPVEELAARGATAAESPRDVEAVVLGADGIAEGMREGGLFVDMSTIGPATSRRIAAVLAERGVDAVDAPVSGGEPAAQSGNLPIRAGGSEGAVDRARPLFDVLGKSTTHIGPAGAGQVAKAANQVVVALTIQAVAEALVLARKAGVDPARVREALLGGFAQSRVLELHGQRMLDGAYD